jgi:hypothetical protein
MASGVSIPISLQDQISSDLDHIRNKLDVFGKANTQVKVGMGMAAGAMAFKAFTGAVDDGVRAVVDMAQAAMAEDAQIVKLTTAIGANVKGWDGNIAAVEGVIDSRKRLAFTDDAMRDSLVRLIPVTRDVGQAFDIQRVAMDLARMKGIDLESASDKIAKALLGNQRVLKELGIELDAGATKTQVLAAIQAAAAGQAEAYTATTAASVEKLGQAFDDLKEDAGRQILFWADDLALGLGKVAWEINNYNIPAFKDYNDYLRFMAAAGAENNDVLREYGDTLGELNAANREAKAPLQAFAEAADTGAEGADGLADAAGGATKAIQTLGEWYNATWSQLATVAQEAADDIYGPAIRAAELAALKREESAQREIIASKDSTTAQVQDAKDRLLALQQEGLGLKIEMAGRGELTKTAYDALITALQKQAASGNAEIAATARATLVELGRLADALNDLPLPVGWRPNVTPPGTGPLENEGRARGGPVRAGFPYVVGERGPELFMPASMGTIIPNGMASSAAIGGRSLTISPGAIVINGSGDPEAVARSVMLALKRETQRQGMSF